MSERKDAAPEPAGLSRRNTPDTDEGYYVPDYVMRDFGETEESPSSSAGVSGRRSSAEFLL
jgi:hypothetical protein